MAIAEACRRKREDIKVRFKGIQSQYTELVNHRKDVDKGIEVLEKEFLRIEGDLRILEELIGDEDKKRVLNK